MNLLSVVQIRIKNLTNSGVSDLHMLIRVEIIFTACEMPMARAHQWGQTK